MRGDEMYRDVYLKALTRVKRVWFRENRSLVQRGLPPLSNEAKAKHLVGLSDLFKQESADILAQGPKKEEAI